MVKDFKYFQKSHTNPNFKIHSILRYDIEVILKTNNNQFKGKFDER